MSSEAVAALGYLSDQETKVDLLNNEAIARTVVRLIREKSDRPITIGIHGDWGAGKSSVLEMVEAAFPDDGPVLCLKFNGWQFQGFEDAKIALIEGVVNGLIENRSLLTKAGDEAKRLLASIDWLKVAKKGGGLAFTALTGLPSWDQIETLAGPLLDRLKSPDISKEEVTTAVEETKALLKDKPAESKSVPKEIKAFLTAYKELIDKAGIERLVVLVDDLDRCVPETAIQTLEAVRLFVAMDKTAFVIGADEGMIQYAVRKHFPDLPERDEYYARSYLEKLLQVPFRIPALGETETQIYVTLLLLGGRLGEDTSEFQELLKLGRTALQEPWEGKGLEHDAIKRVLKEQYNALQPVIVMAEQISPVLAAGTKGNPRQIKRFLNALTLRLAVAESRGFGKAIEQTHLAKLMLAELFLPESVFNHIASSAANAQDGICPELAALEAFVANGASTPAESGTAPTEEDADEAKPKAETNATLEEWKTRPEVLRWAAIQPSFARVSLKPYLFVIKDRRNFLSSAAPLPPKLAALLERLCGGEMAAKAATSDVRGLLPLELDPLFNALRTRVLANTSFEKRPDAMAGVAALVEAHTSLQGRYVDLLEALPPKKLGPWIATSGAIVTNAGLRSRFDALSQRWIKEGGAPLRAALTTGAEARRKVKG